MTDIANAGDPGSMYATFYQLVEDVTAQLLGIKFVNLLEVF